MIASSPSMRPWTGYVGAALLVIAGAWMNAPEPPPEVRPEPVAAAAPAPAPSPAGVDPSKLPGAPSGNAPAAPAQGG